MSYAIDPNLIITDIQLHNLLTASALASDSIPSSDISQLQTYSVLMVVLVQRAVAIQAIPLLDYHSSSC